VADLAKIPEKGFNVLGIRSSKGMREQIAIESVGLPIITQQLCQEIARNHDRSPGKRSNNVQREALDEALKFVVDNLYANHRGDYDQLITGPRKTQRKHATYEKILASFALDPLQFSLRYHELIERVSSIRSEGEDIPNASINAALRALGRFQERSKMRLLDWHEDERVLYIVEPSFLFYLRQKIEGVSEEGSIQEKITNLFRILEEGIKELEVKVQNRPPLSPESSR
jgi:hypothetical protein